MFKVRMFSDRGFKDDYRYVEADTPEAAVARHLQTPVTRRYASDGRLRARVVTPNGEVIDFFEPASALV